jgi:NitT/TauT family transport system ATP-binding protein
MPIQFENTTLPAIIELRNITQTYYIEKKKQEVIVIKDLNLLIEDKPNQGQFIVILGKSGCGKSTVLKYIAGLQKPTSGDVFLNGKPRSQKDQVGMVFQKYSSFPWLTVLENVAVGLKFAGISKKEREEKAMEMIKLVGLEGHEKKYAKDKILSGGQLQRVAIARSLVSNPNILLLDEPFGALDVHTRCSMQELLGDIWSKPNMNLTVVFVTHDIPEAVFLGDEVLIMSSNPGTIVEKIKMDIPLTRAKYMKREKKFTDLIYSIEDKLTQA